MEEYPKVYLYKRIVQAKLFIDTNFGDDIDLNNISDNAYFSKFHFIRLFKKIYGKSPHQYLTKVRIDNARDLLEKGNSIADTCFNVGFNSITSFAGLFKRHTNLSPLQYQQNYQQRKQLIDHEPLAFIPNCFADKKGWLKNSNFQEAW